MSRAQRLDSSTLSLFGISFVFERLVYNSCSYDYLRFTLDLDGHNSISTSPEQTNSCWKQAVQLLNKPVNVSSSIPILVSHSDTHIKFEVSRIPE